MGVWLRDREWNGEPDQIVDCAIIGGGPGGLTAAVYLARFMRRCAVIDAGFGRAASIPRSQNLPGFPDGIAGVDFLVRLEAQLERYGGLIRRGEVDAIASSGDAFLISQGLDVIKARSVILATGVVNHRPAIPAAMHDAGVARGLIRYCPICDGYEARHSVVAVLGADRHGAEEARFLSGFGADVTLLAYRALELEADEIAALQRDGVSVVQTPVARLFVQQERIEAVLTDDQRLTFDTLYPALGSSPRSQLGISLGAKTSASGCIVTDQHQRTTVAGVYAVGDVVEGLDQISVALGQAATAATAVHNQLRDQDLVSRPFEPAPMHPAG